MNYEEFKQSTIEKATYETFQKFEKMYMAGDVDKDIFCRLMKPLVVAITEAAPFRAAQDTAYADYRKKVTLALVALEEGDLEAFANSMEDAKEAGRSYIHNKEKADAFFAKLK